MKISAADIKNFDYKKFGINHGEKIVMGIIVLFAASTLWGTRWKPYARNPGEMSDKTTVAREKIDEHGWLESEKKKYSADEGLVARAKEMMRPVQPTPYTSSVPFYDSIFPHKEKNEEPKWLRPRNLMADSGKTAIVFPDSAAMAAAAAQRVAEEKAGEKQKDQSNIPEEFRERQDRKKRGNTGFGQGLGRGGFGIGMRRDDDDEDDDDIARPRPKPKKRGRSHREDREFQQVANAQSRGTRFNAVRAVIPIRRQGQMVAEAFHEPIHSDMYDRLNILDFELQRQQLLPAGTWTDWASVDVSIAKELLLEAGNLDPEVVDPVITDPSVTMPLPPRAFGMWSKKFASHPDVENFELSQEQIDIYVELQEKLIQAKEERDQETEEEDPALETAPKKGFNDLQYNTKQIVNDISKSRGGTKRNSGKLDEIAKEVAEAGDDPDKRRQTIINNIKKRFKAGGSYVLFRYFDFDVEKGNAYRYRVRIIYNNPNFGFGLDKVVGPSVSAGNTRPTGWSEPTDPVIVPDDDELFLAGVSPSRGSTEAAAEIDMFQWYADTGTTINEKIKTRRGQFIGGEVKTPLLDAAKNVFEDQKVNFHSDQMLVDIFENPQVDHNFHPDLLDKPLSKGRLDLTPRVLLVNEFGDLTSLDPASKASDYQQRQTYLEYEQRPFKDLLVRSRDKIKRERERASLDDDAKNWDDDDDEDRRPRRRRGGGNRRRNPSMKRGGGVRRSR